LIYGRECILPVEFSIPSWRVVDWTMVRSREDLLLARMTQLDEQALDQARAAEALEESRTRNKEYFDAKRRLRKSVDQQIKIGDLVLLHNTSIQKSHNKKLEDNWFGPYRVREVTDSGYYRIEELDGTILTESIAGNRLKRFFTRQELDADNSMVIDNENGDDENGLVSALNDTESNDEPTIPNQTAQPRIIETIDAVVIPRRNRANNEET